MPRLLYLDLNHWITLAQARVRSSGEGSELLARLRDAVLDGELVAPLSAAHYIEIFRIKDPAQRADIALVMDEISQYVTLTNREELIAHELRVSMAAVLGVTYQEPAPPVLGYGFGHAFGHGTIVGQIKGDAAAIEAYAAAHGAEAERRAEELAGRGWRYSPAAGATAVERLQDVTDKASQFRMLRGPDDHDLPALAKDGYNPYAADRVTQAIQQREAELARFLRDEPVGPERLGEYITARALAWDLLEDWDQALSDIGRAGMTLEQIGRPNISRIVNGVPIVDVESAIRRRRFRNQSNTWSTNDVRDIAFVGQAVVYCDAVLTDKDLRANVAHQRLNAKYRTELLRDLRALQEWLVHGRVGS